MDVFSGTSDFLSPETKVNVLNSQIDWVMTQRKIDYLDQILTLHTHKSVAVKRKIAKNLEKLMPLEKLNELKEWQNSEGDRETYLALEALIGKVERGALHAVDTSAKIFTVEEVVTLLKNIIGDTEYIIEGELSDYKVYSEYYSFFTLKGAEDDGISCMVLRNVTNRVSFPLNSGLKIRVKGFFKITKNVRVQFSVESIELTGEGELLRNFKLLQDKLFHEGLFDPARKRPLPLFPHSIILIASTNSAALTDYTKVFSRRRGNTTLYQVPIKTQGVGAEEDILEALQKCEELIAKYQVDLIVMTRGGGASEDLSVFNSERIVRAFYSLSTPTIAAIGHEKDTTLVELVADVRASTPSQAAELSSLSNQEVENTVSYNFEYIKNWVFAKQTAYKNTEIQLWNSIVQLITRRITLYRQETTQLFQSSTQLFAKARTQTDALMSSLLYAVRSQIFATQNSLPDIISFSRQLIERLRTLQSQAETTSTSISDLSPRKILERGYSILSNENGVITSVSAVHGNLDLELSDGQIKVSRLS